MTCDAGHGSFNLVVGTRVPASSLTLSPVIVIVVGSRYSVVGSHLTLFTHIGVSYMWE